MSDIGEPPSKDWAEEMMMNMIFVKWRKPYMDGREKSLTWTDVRS